MNILVIDTSSNICTVGVKKEDTIVIQELDEGKTHSENLMPLIQEVFKKVGMKTRDLQIIAVTVGPGSFTGIRIGIATAKALGFTGDIKGIEINSTEVLARNIVENVDYKVGIIDSRNNQVYAGIYTNEYELVKEYAGDIDDFLEMLNTEIRDKDRSIAFSGTGIIHKEKIINNLKFAKIIFADEVLQRGKMLMQAAIDKSKDEKNMKDLKKILPNYLKKSNAER